MYETVLFDLDGTLVDSGIGITNSVLYALKKYQIETAERTELYKFIGPPLHESFENFYGFSKKQAKEAVEYYREYYCRKGIYENIIYEGMEELLKRLHASGKTLMVATSKPKVFAEKILRHIGIADYFSYIAGANLDGSRTDKYEVILYALHAGNISDFSKAIMIGDREHDIWGAKKVGIASVGVLFGYGNYEELQRAGADYIVEKAEEIFSVL